LQPDDNEPSGFRVVVRPTTLNFVINIVARRCTDSRPPADAAQESGFLGANFAIFSSSAGFRILKLGGLGIIPSLSPLPSPPLPSSLLEM